MLWKGLRDGLLGSAGFGAHLAVAGGLGITRGHAGGDLGGAAAGLLKALNGRGRLSSRRTSAAPVRDDAPAHFLLPGICGVGLAERCAQGFSLMMRFPGPLLRPDRQLRPLKPVGLRDVAFMKEGRSREKQAQPGPWNSGGVEMIRFLPVARAARRLTDAREACFAMLTLVPECAYVTLCLSRCWPSVTCYLGDRH